jgi:hypothetical protein
VIARAPTYLCMSIPEQHVLYWWRLLMGPCDVSVSSRQASPCRRTCSGGFRTTTCSNGLAARGGSGSCRPGPGHTCNAYQNPNNYYTLYWWQQGDNRQARSCGTHVSPPVANLRVTSHCSESLKSPLNLREKSTFPLFQPQIVLHPASAIGHHHNVVVSTVTP